MSTFFWNKKTSIFSDYYKNQDPKFKFRSYFIREFFKIVVKFKNVSMIS